MKPQLNYSPEQTGVDGFGQCYYRSCCVSGRRWIKAVVFDVATIGELDFYLFALYRVRLVHQVS
jgi:hypothetical protein